MEAENRSNWPSALPQDMIHDIIQKLDSLDVKFRLSLASKALKEFARADITHLSLLRGEQDSKCIIALASQAEQGHFKSLKSITIYKHRSAQLADCVRIIRAVTTQLQSLILEYKLDSIDGVMELAFPRLEVLQLGFVSFCQLYHIATQAPRLKRLWVFLIDENDENVGAMIESIFEIDNSVTNEELDASVLEYLIATNPFGLNAQLDLNIGPFSFVIQALNSHSPETFLTSLLRVITKPGANINSRYLLHNTNLEMIDLVIETVGIARCLIQLGWDVGARCCSLPSKNKTILENLMILFPNQEMYQILFEEKLLLVDGEGGITPVTPFEAARAKHPELEFEKIALHSMRHLLGSSEIQ